MIVSIIKSIDSDCRNYIYDNNFVTMIFFNNNLKKSKLQYDDYIYINYKTIALKISIIVFD